MASFLHTGRAGELAMPFQSGDGAGVTGILDAIVADIGAGVGQWSVYDDQRAGLWFSSLLLVSTASSNTGSNFLLAPTAITLPWPAPTNTALYLALGSKIRKTTGPGATRTVATMTSVAQGTLDQAWDGNPALNTPLDLFMRAVVLKCNSAIRPFYVLILERNNARLPISFQVFETWDNVTHSGTGGGPIDYMRARMVGAETYFWPTTPGTPGNPKTYKVQYIMSLKDEAFTFWLSGDPTEGALSCIGPVMSDLYHCGHLSDNSYEGDDFDIVHLATTTYFSRTTAITVGASNIQSTAAGAVMRGLNGSEWPDDYKCDPIIDPYFNDPMRSNYDYGGRFIATPFAFMNVSFPGGSNPYAAAHVRGLVRSVLCPVSTPDFHLSRKNIALDPAVPNAFTEHILVTVCGNTNEASSGSGNGNYEVESLSAATAARFQNAFGLTTRTNLYQLGSSYQFARPKWYLIPLD